jgi:3-hydroxyacyl-CoA dehydrogenase
MVENFQRTSMTIKHSLVPVVSAVRGMAFGGGCEFQMHSARTVAALESYIGLVEAGVGLLPAGGGLHELAVRAAKANPGDPFEELKKVFETVAMAKVSASALEAKQLGLLRDSDVVVFNAYELLYVAKQVANALAESGYRPPLPARAIRSPAMSARPRSRPRWPTCRPVTSPPSTTWTSPRASPTPCAAA